MPFSSSERATKVLNTGKWIEIGKVIYSNRNYNKIKIAEDVIEQIQLVNDYIRKIEITALKKGQR